MQNSIPDAKPTKPLSQMNDSEAQAAGLIRVVRLGSVDELLRRPVRWHFGRGVPPRDERT